MGRKIPLAKTGDWFEVIFQLEKHGILTQQEYSRLKENYAFLRLVSHRLQLVQQVPTDVLPKTESLENHLNSQLRIHFGSTEDFRLLEKVTEASRDNLTILSHLLQSNEEEASDVLKDLVLTNDVGDEMVTGRLSELGFRHVDNADQVY